MDARAKTSGRLPRSARSESVATALEIRRQNIVLRRLIEHVRNFSPEIGDSFPDEEPASCDEPEQAIAHRRPHRSAYHHLG